MCLFVCLWHYPCVLKWLFWQTTLAAGPAKTIEANSKTRRAEVAGETDMVAVTADSWPPSYRGGTAAAKAGRKLYKCSKIVNVNGNFN